jgi:hypothetical protein
MHDESITERDLSEIEARCEAATLGPWRSFIEGRDHTSGADFIMTGPETSRGPDIEATGATRADQEFIAYARTYHGSSQRCGGCEVWSDDCGESAA